LSSAACCSEGLGVGWNERDTTDPVALAPGQAIALAFAVERHLCPLQERGIDVLACIDADDRVDVAVNCAGDDWHDAALGADMKLGGLRPEGICRNLLGILDADRERARRTGSPHTTMLDAERARASPGRDFLRLRLPVQLEGDIAAMAVARNQHGGSALVLPTPNE
jgi:hypothetical protein